MNSKAQSPFRVSLHELPRRAGEMREYVRDIVFTEGIGIPLLQIPPAQPIHLEFKAESVDDGVLISGTVQSRATGECGRCLEKIDMDIDQRFQELFLYSSRASENPEDDDEIFLLDGDVADLEIPIRDAVILSMPIHPLCSDDCEGLCAVCGEKWLDLPDDHAHEALDPRWTGLEGWKSE